VAADAGRFLLRALAERVDACLFSPEPLTVVAIGKAAAPMVSAFLRSHPGPVAAALAASMPTSVSLPPSVEWYRAGHPVPDDVSEQAGRRALALAASRQGPLVVLLSGGASALVAVPRPGVTLDDKRLVTRQLLAAGADIGALNTVRKHLSDIKGGWLAAASRRPTIAFVISDVVGDDLSVIGSGPTVADPTTFAAALDVLDRFGGRSAYPVSAVRLLLAGHAGTIPDTPKPGDLRLQTATTRVIGSSRDVLHAAADAAAGAGYIPTVITEPVVGEARHVAPAHVARMLEIAGRAGGRAAVLSAGETTVRVSGTGRGGRNQEFVLAAASRLRRLGRSAVFASIGTDGIDGPTDAAGAMADPTTIARVEQGGFSIAEALDNNDSYALLAALGDLIKTGATDTNVGDLQVLLVE
jgi:hydroxypyruvate reductase